MPKLIVTANKLNKRSHIPVTLPDRSGIVGVVNKGFSFDAIEQAGPNPSLGKWYKDRDGYYYWGGGVSIAPDEITRKADAWFYKLGISELHNVCKGGNVKVAVLDSGIMSRYTQQFFQQSYDPASSRCFTNTSLDDTFGHGTHCAGLIGGALNDDLLSIAPEVKLFIGKISNAGTPSIANFRRALEWVKSNRDIDILSISGGLFDDDPQIAQLVKDIAVQDTIIVSSIGNWPEHESGLYPARYTPYVISVGSANEDDELSSFTIRDPRLSICVPGENIRSLYTSSVREPLSGTSQACAIMAGMASIIISKLKDGTSNKITLAEFSKFIENNSTIKSADNFNYRVLKPLSFT